MDIVLRTDASTASGLGHLKRCLSLAQALRVQGATCHFAMRELGLDNAALLAPDGFGLLRLPAPSAAGPLDAGPALAHAGWAGVSQAQDAADTLAALRGLAPRWLVVDHYALDARWHRPVAAALATRLAAIDDLGDRDLAVDLLIDPNHAADHRAKYGPRLAASATLLGGPRHALLAPAYADAPAHVAGDRVESIGIFMGGVDAAGLSVLALAACRAAGFGGPVEIATTSANPGLAALREAAARHPGSRVLCDLPELSGFFARHGLQIGAGGGATWERCCVGAPTLALAVADNQRQVLAPLDGMDVLQLARPGPVTVASLAADLRRLLDDPARRRRLSSRARALVDGQGARRVAEALLRAA